MSKDVDANTMGQLAGGTPAHAVQESPSADVLLQGTVLIARDAEGMSRAQQLRAMLDRTIGALQTAGFAVLLAVLIAAPFATQAQDRPTWSPRAAEERSYGQMTKAQLVELNQALRQISRSPSRVEIYCGGSYCRAAAEDLDEAFESAGFDAYLETPIFDPGKGLGISPDTAQTRAMAAAIKKASGGKIDLAVFTPTNPSGTAVPLTDKVQILLARKKR